VTKPIVLKSILLERRTARISGWCRYQSISIIRATAEAAAANYLSPAAAIQTHGPNLEGCDRPRCATEHYTQ